MNYLNEVFNQEGFLAKGNPSYELPPQQVQFAEGVDRAFSDARHLLAEGPCGCWHIIKRLGLNLVFVPRTP